MSILNAITAGAGGVSLSGDTSGNLTIQSAGSNVATFTANNVLINATSVLDPNGYSTSGGHFVQVSSTTTDRGSFLVLSGGGGGANGYWAGGVNFAASGQAYPLAEIKAATGSTSTSGNLTFSTSNDTTATPTDRMRITNTGAVLVGSTTPLANGGRLQVSSTGIHYNGTCTNNVNGDIGMLISLGANCNSTASNHFICATGGADKMYVYGNGNVVNVNNSYGTLSDAKLKENIVDATPKLDKLMQLKVRNFNLIGDELNQIGFIAQELEQVFPSLIQESPDYDEERNLTGTTTKGIKTSVLIPILVKAIQELKAEVDALKGAK